MNKEERIIELTAKLNDLKTKRTAIYTEINNIDNELQELKWANDSLIGKCFYQKSDFGSPVHFYKIISIDKNKSDNNCNNTWYNYMYINTSDTWTTISFSLGTKEDIFDSTYAEITSEIFDIELKNILKNIETRVKDI
jgi:hypothetical protein